MGIQDVTNFWTEKEMKTLKTFLTKRSTIDSASKKLDRSPDAIISKARSCGYGYSKVYNMFRPITKTNKKTISKNKKKFENHYRKWTQSEISYINEFVQNNPSLSIKACYSSFTSRFGKTRSLRAVRNQRDYVIKNLPTQYKTSNFSVQQCSKKTNEISILKILQLYNIQLDGTHITMPISDFERMYNNLIS